MIQNNIPQYTVPFADDRLVESTTRHNLTVPQLFDMVGDDTTRRWEVLGQTDSKVHWAYGAEADALIAEGFAAMTVYKAIAIKAGKGSQTIRKAYYTYKAFDAQTREKYDLAPYSVFQHARTQKEPIKVLEHYIQNRASLDEIEKLYPIIEDEEFEKYFNGQGYPRIFYGIAREIYGIDPFMKARVEEHLHDIRIILDEVNK